MGKPNKFQDELANLGGKLKEKEDTTPIQTIMPVTTTKSSQVEETKFTVHIPTDLMDNVKEIGFKNKKKIKTLFVEALAEYVEKNKKQ